LDQEEMHLELLTLLESLILVAFGVLSLARPKQLAHLVGVCLILVGLLKIVPWILISIMLG